jgi:hypothetical protein
VLPDVKGTRYEDAATVLGALDVMVGGDGVFRPDDSITRAEFAKVAVHLLGLEENADAEKGNSRFADVSIEHWANGYINIASQQQIIIGDDQGNFRPNEQISYQDALTILVRLLGYEKSAAAKGGYPTGYLMVANSKSITRNAPGSNSDGAKRGIVAILAYNSLTVGMMEQKNFGANESYEETDKTILESNLDTVKNSGQVTGNYFTKLDSASGLQEDEIEIDGVVYKLADPKAANALGQRANYYVKTLDNDDEVIVLVKPETSKNKVLTVDGDNIDTVSEDKINYWINKETDNNSKIAKIAADAKMIYNGVYTELDMSKITEGGAFNGTVELLDNTQDDSYDVIFVNEYNNLVVESTSTLSYTVSDKFGNTSLVFDEDDDSVKFSLQDVNGNSFAFDDLEEWMVISYLKSADGSVVKAVVVSATVTGKVNEIDDDKYAIDGNYYKKAANYEDTVNLLDEGTFYLDIRNAIAAVDASATLSQNYAYLMDAAANDGMSTNFDMKVYDKNGETKVLSSADKVALNSTTKDTALNVLDILKDGGSVEKQLITYELNSEGKVTKINTANKSAAVSKDKFTMNYDLTDAVYKSASKKLGGYTLTDKTVVFDIPATAVDEDDYAIRNYEMFENDSKYNVEIYDLSDDLSAKVVLVKNSDSVISAETPIAVVSKIANIKNAKDESVEKLYAIRNGQSIEIESATDGVLTDLKAGDIIRYRTNSAGAIDRVEVLLAMTGKDTEFMVPADGSKADLRLVYGKVDKKFATSINVSVDGGSAENFDITNAKVVSVDTTKSSNAVKVASIGDIQKYDAASPRLVFLRIYKDEVKEVVIVR